MKVNIEKEDSVHQTPPEAAEFVCVSGKPLGWAGATSPRPSRGEGRWIKMGPMPVHALQQSPHASPPLEKRIRCKCEVARGPLKRRARSPMRAGYHGPGHLALTRRRAWPTRPDP